MKILLFVEDDITAKLLKSIIQQEFQGMNVHWADSFSAGKDLLSHEQYELIIVHNLISGRASLEVVYYIRKECELLMPIIMLSDTSIESFQKKAFQAGVTSFILQPFDRKDVVDEIRKSLSL